MLPLRYGLGEGNFNIVIVNDVLETAYTTFLGFIKEQYPLLK